MNLLFKILNLTLLGCSSLSASLWVNAGQMYVYQDKDGGTLLTNRKNNDQSLKAIKITYYPDSNIHSYSNWGSNEAAVPVSHSKNKNAYDHYIHQASQSHGVSAGLIKAVMHTESGFNANARSPVGAQGLMQLMPATAKRFKVSNAFDPQQNIFAGAKYLAWLLKRFNGNTQLALAAYNAGEGNVAKYGGIPPFKETQDYVRRVTSRYNNLYAHGVSQDQVSGSNTDYSQNATNLSTSPASNNVTSPQARYAQVPIVVAEDAPHTNNSAGSYSTAYATATAKIYISN
ncbi:transglycosylase-like protein with SLT domain [Acinetobacter calcoaceticus]|uniref:Transglycosylase-like protein with SLT domain n=1 Tax=Acinetobacter calcoaceticus TaxID=471 RepID=A0A4V2R156_ACICA|nr:transglycosylase-like protein with SLT domain [Acinetobacter calcoaceticus]